MRKIAFIVAWYICSATARPRSESTPLAKSCCARSLSNVTSWKISFTRRRETFPRDASW